MDTTLILFGIVVLLVLAGALYFVGKEERAQTGLPEHAPVVYQDTQERVEKPLYSAKYRLTGKPDYLVLENGLRIPVEVKPNRRAKQPRVSDTMQLASYCLLVEEVFGTRPTHGLLKYEAQTFRIEYTDELKTNLLAIMDRMRNARRLNDVRRNHHQEWKCAACGYKATCGQALSKNPTTPQ